jgi:hypothetical protein
MTRRSLDAEDVARAFPSPQNSRPARSLTYEYQGCIYQAIIGRKRRQWDDSVGSRTPRARTSSASRATGNVVLSIVANKAAIEIWSREPACGWPNPSLVALDSVLDINYLEDPEADAADLATREHVVAATAFLLQRSALGHRLPICGETMAGGGPPRCRGTNYPWESGRSARICLGLAKIARSPRQNQANRRHQAKPHADDARMTPTTA